MKGGPQQPNKPKLRLVPKSEAEQPKYDYCSKCGQTVEGGECNKVGLCDLGEKLTQPRTSRLSNVHAQLTAIEGGLTYQN